MAIKKITGKTKVNRDQLITIELTKIINLIKRMFAYIQTLIKQTLMIFLETNGLIHDRQYGFR